MTFKTLLITELILLLACAQQVVAAPTTSNSLFPASLNKPCVPESKKTLPTYKRMIVFGDSLSDQGTYAHAAKKIAEASGRFTNYSEDSKIWVDFVAQGLGLTISANRMDGMGLPQPILSTATDAFNYAQGGSRLTEPKGEGSEKGYSTRPITQQIDYFLDQHKTFNKHDIVFVLSGANDVFAYLKEAQAKPELLEPEQIKKFADDAVRELAKLLNKIEQNGNPHIVVLSLPDLSATPRATVSQTTKILKSMVDLYNKAIFDDIKDFSWWTGGLGGDAAHHNMKTTIVDLYKFDKKLNKNPGRCGIVELNIPVCKVPKELGSTSLFCGKKYMTENVDATTYKFADSVHPTVAVNKYFAEYILFQIAERNGVNTDPRTGY